MYEYVKFSLASLENAVQSADQGFVNVAKDVWSEQRYEGFTYFLGTSCPLESDLMRKL
jgi:hypothetical protein